MLRTGKNTGFTLMEMMVVIAVMSILMGIGAVSLMRMSKGYETTGEATVVVSYLQGTRNLAVSSGMEADLRIIKSDGVTIMKMSGLQVAGSFFMEDDTGSFRNTFNPSPGSFEPGVVGDCLAFDSAGRVNLGNDERWGMSSGFHVSFYVKIEPVTAEVTIIEKENLFSLSCVPIADERLAALQLTVTLADTSTLVTLVDGVPFEFSKWMKIGVSWKDPIFSLYQNDAAVFSGDYSVGISTDDSGDLLLNQDAVAATLAIDELIISRYGDIGERSLSEGAVINRLEANLADANPDNDFLLFTYMPDGRFRSLPQNTETVQYRNSTATIRLESSGEVYVSGL